MNKIFRTLAGVAMTATLLLVSGCHDKEETTNPYLTMGNDARPEWLSEEPNYLDFEHTMAVDVNLQDALLPYASEEDLMCATIGGQVRGVTLLDNSGGEVSFPLVIAGNSGDGAVSLHYYCSRLRRIYSIQDWMPFSPSKAPTDGGSSYKPQFIPEE